MFRLECLSTREVVPGLCEQTERYIFMGSGIEPKMHGTFAVAMLDGDKQTGRHYLGIISVHRFQLAIICAVIVPSMLWSIAIPASLSSRTFFATRDALCPSEPRRWRADTAPRRSP
jgi:hypothetical protein